MFIPFLSHSYPRVIWDVNYTSSVNRSVSPIVPAAASRAHVLVSKRIRVEEETTSGVTVLELPEGEVWPAVNDPKLFVRLAYRQYYDMFIKGHRSPMENKSIVCGTPGIGKSAAGMYFLYRALREGKMVVYRAYAQDVYTVYDHDTQTKYPILSTTLISDLLNEPTTLLICDGIPPPSQCKCSVVLITSPKRDVWLSFSKEPGCIQRYIPPPSLAEMKLMREHCFPQMSENTMMEGIDLFGSNPRAVFLKFLPKEWTKSTIEALVQSVGAELLINAEQMDSTGKDDPSHRLIFINATDTFRDGGRQFASDFVAGLVYEKLVRDENDKFHAWLKIAGVCSAVSNLRAHLFERVSIDTIAEGGEFDTMDMITGEHKQVSFPVRQVQACDALPQSLDVNVLLRTPHKKYPAIDGITSDASGLLFTFNATVNPAHSVLMLDSTQQHGLVRLQEKYQPGRGSCQHFLLLPKDKFSEAKKLTPSMYKWNDPHRRLFKSGQQIAQNFTEEDKAVKQNAWDISAISIPLGSNKSNPGIPMIKKTSLFDNVDCDPTLHALSFILNSGLGDRCLPTTHTCPGYVLSDLHHRTD